MYIPSINLFCLYLKISNGFYINGEDLNTNYDQSASRWVINFRDWALSPEYDDPKNPKGAPYASDYPDCLEIVERLVKTERESKADKNQTNKDTAKRWWQFKRITKELYEMIAQCDRVLVAVQTSKYLSLSFQPTNIIFSHMTVVFTFNEYKYFSILNTSWHTEWIFEYCSSLETRLRYIPTDGFETFPFPTLTPETEKELETIGEKYYSQRQQIMQTTQLGLTKTYNRFHDPNDTAIDIQQLRELPIQMDYAVAKAYGWGEELRITNWELRESNSRWRMGFIKLSKD